MTAILLTMLFMLIAAFSVWSYYLSPTLKKGIKGDNNALYIIFTVAAAVLLRLILSTVYKGHSTDMTNFTVWSDTLFREGITKFYKLDMTHDYPPGYMYVLYILGAIRNGLGLSNGASWLVMKLPAIICDALTAVFIYKIAKKHLSDAAATIIAALYLFNPTMIVNCSLWGQMDSVYTLLALLMVYCITEKKMTASYFLYAIGIFTKPQAFLFTPILIAGIIENVFLDNFSREKFIKNLIGGLSAIAALVLLTLPFGIVPVIVQYKDIFASYPHITVNAFNIWAALGKNWDALSTPLSLFGYALLAAISVYSVFVILKSKNKTKYYFTTALITFLTYMLSTKMHERYSFPAMTFMLLAFAVSTDIKSYLLYILISLSQFFNSAWVLFIYQQDPSKYFKSPVIIVASIINILIMAYLIYIAHKQYINNEPYSVTAKPQKTVKPALKQNNEKHFSISEHFPKITRFDIIAMAVITAVYAGIALFNLGDMHAPESEYMMSNNSVTLDLGEDTDIGEYKLFLGSYELNENRALDIRFTRSDNSETYHSHLTNGSVFHWEEIEADATARYITLSTTADTLSIKELGVFDMSGKQIPIISASDLAGNRLFDEQSEVPERSSFKNSTYFDEIYHARTGYEFVHSLPVYEWTHPPLGKVFIAAGIKLFGMCPFGWRIAGTLFGIIMVPIIYLFALRLLKKSWLAVVTCLLFTFDFMHFAQTRIATIDVYVTFFIMLMYLFMFKYYSTSFYDTSFRKGLKNLALCGIFMGLGIASKWTGVYAGIGLAVLFFITLCKRYNEYRYAVKNPSGETDGISHRLILESFRPNTIKTIVWCCIFFILVPLAIYIVSYIPYLNAPDEHGIASIINNQNSMLTYHSKTVLGSTHPFSSRWYEWIIMKRPIWYYSGELENGLKEGISSFGNPLVWWLGIPAFFYMIYRIFSNKDKNALFLCIAYLAQLVSWIPVTRLTFIYHYFPCVPFIVLMIGYSILCIYNGAKNKKAVMYGAFVYAGLVIVLFAMFYPVLSGLPCSPEYADNFLKWFDSWILL